MNKRNFIKTVGLMSFGAVIYPLYRCENNTQNKELEKGDISPVNGTFVLPKLSFAYAALAPQIDEETMEIHHSKHHKGYVDKLNKAVTNSNFKNNTLEEILNSISDSENDEAIRNNAGGHFNHSLLWEILMPGGAKEPGGTLLDQINKDFGSFSSFSSEFAKSAAEVFGSGWAWLCVANNGQLIITNTSNQDNPLMKKIVDTTGSPILGIDVWEHAYYLNYQNERKKYISNFMELINWDVVFEKYKAVK